MRPPAPEGRPSTASSTALGIGRQGQRIAAGDRRAGGSGGAGHGGGGMRRVPAPAQRATAATLERTSWGCSRPPQPVASLPPAESSPQTWEPLAPSRHRAAPASTQSGSRRSISSPSAVTALQKQLAKRAATPSSAPSPLKGIADQRLQLDGKAYVVDSVSSNPGIVRCGLHQAQRQP